MEFLRNYSDVMGIYSDKAGGKAQDFGGFEISAYF